MGLHGVGQGLRLGLALGIITTLCRWYICYVVTAAQLSRIQPNSPHVALALPTRPILRSY